MANVKISELPLGTPNSTSIFPFVDSGTTYQGAISAITSNGGGVVEITYSGLVDKITGETLSPGTFYTITDFRTCYDQPDFTWEGNSITEGNYKQSDVEPIVVFATSANTISTTAYQPLYPNDRIQYDWTFSATEVTQGVAYGRITERIDEFNNRTDYDHRTILFKRYRLYTYRQDQPLNGTIELLEDGVVNGTNTAFESLSVGDVIYVPTNPSYYEIIFIIDDFGMVVSGDTIPNGVGSGLQFYKAIEEITNDDEYGGYFSYKRTNVKTDDFIEYTTFGDAISENYAKNNYVGNYANNYTNISDGTFILANNVFIQGQYESNKFGDYCYNNTWGTDNGNNIWGDYCYNNVSTNDIDDNIIGHYFNNNLINTNLTDNHIGNDFNDNKLLAENEEDFADNIIGNGFNGNTIYSRFYQNEILDNFNDNVIGDSVSLTEFEFYRNYIRNNFNENTIRQDFQNNQIGTNFQENEINGEFKGNTILNGFNGNDISDGFELNNIGNGFNENTVYDDFYNNTTDYYFNNNIISYDFYNNNIGSYFEDNQPPNSDLFGWNNLSTVSARTYDTFRVSLNNSVGNYILGKQLVMRVISTSQYFKIKFTKWTQGGNGGGFQYERQELDSNGNSIGNSIIFTKTNGGSEVDIIVEGVVELTRDSQGGLYNTITDTPPFNNQWPGPGDTEWNSIYTQENNGRRFTYNKIGNQFRDNEIGSYFGYDDENDENENGNKIGDNFRDNTIVSTMYGNVIGNNFNNNTIYSEFYDNEILNDFNNNTIGNSVDLDNFNFYRNYIRNNFNENIIRQDFQNNQIGTNFQENEINGEFKGNVILNGYNNNTIGNYFNLNNIGNAFNNNTVYDDFNNNTTNYGFDSNVISSNFFNNNIGNYFEDNEPFNTNLFGWNNLSTVSTRTYNTLRNSLNNSVGNYIIGQELIMRVISTSQYFKIKFTQWTQNGNGGGFQYERQELDSNGNNIGSLITFIKTNNGSEVDIIVEGVVELTRDSQGGLYNTITDTPPFNNQWPGPGDTEWNSIYTQLNNGENFAYNTIGDSFRNNVISDNFQYNQIGNRFEDNSIGEGFGFGGTQAQGNRIGNYFVENSIGEYFYNNVIPDNFANNTIDDYFQWNNVQSLVQNTTLTSCPLYSGVTVNVFKNGNGDNRLSYYDEFDVLTIDSLTASGCPVISFTITSSDFTSGTDIDDDTTPLGDNGVDGFENTDSQNTLLDGYRGQGLSGTSLSQLSDAYNALGLATDNSTGYVWEVTWGEGSSIESGLVKFGSSVDNEYFYIQTIDENDNDWQTPNTNEGTSLAGTFLFPATFTAYLPLINKDGWC